jgi:dTDP-4-amino-4,6-dideoxygalactose transaminase
MEQASIPVFAPHLGIDTLKAVTDAFNVGWIGMGATTRAFEDALQSYLQTDRHVVATMTGTAALHLGLLLAGVKPGDEVILPSFNYIADVQAILWCGAVPVFCDIDERTLALDPIRVIDLITPRTKAIMPLHFAGRVGDIDAIYRIADQNHLRVIEDATHALGSSHLGHAIGSFGDITCFSFDPVKLITCLDGGALVCRSTEDVATLHRLRLLGVDRDTEERYKNRRAWDYDVTAVGFRAHMTNINAAIGLSQLSRIDEFIANRRRDCRAYDEAFASLDHVQVIETDWDVAGPFIYSLRIPDGHRDSFVAHLGRHGIATGIHFLPCHQMTLCTPFPRGPLEATDRTSCEIVTLPLWSNMPADIRDRVVNGVCSFAHAAVPMAVLP